MQIYYGLMLSKLVQRCSQIWCWSHSTGSEQPILTLSLQTHIHSYYLRSTQLSILQSNYNPQPFLWSHYDVVNRYMNELHEEADETHDGKPYRCCHSNLLKLLAVRLCAALDKTYGVLCKLLCGINVHHYLIHCFRSSCFYESLED